MAFLCGFFGLAIFPCLFYYDEALRRSTGDEALRKDESSESSEFRQMPSDLLELRTARTDAKFVRSHDASLFLKRNELPQCVVTVGDTKCEYPKKALSPECCKAYQEEVCYGFKERNNTFRNKPPCDELDLSKKPSLDACKTIKEQVYIHIVSFKCIKAAITKTIRDNRK
eukprot:TRINITY_DN1945_c0_g4_i1.p1 TRINITY_DN1945_c0_g4~~TRINITY_DN1945_c0_g4_i1.p1  ORF type:complete len:170 (-),score=19.53 TRINITY_DN1945_c0_g4_i1:120-629(-)